MFGVARADIEQRITVLEQVTHEHFKKVEQQHSQSIQNIQAAMEEAINKLEDRLSLSDQGQEDKNTAFVSCMDKISSNLEMTETNSKQENDELHTRLDNEIKALTLKFNEQLDQALEKLNRASGELDSSKTDRKTLAKL